MDQGRQVTLGVWHVCTNFFVDDLPEGIFSLMVRSQNQFKHIYQELVTRFLCHGNRLHEQLHGIFVGQLVIPWWACPAVKFFAYK